MLTFAEAYSGYLEGMPRRITARLQQSLMSWSSEHRALPPDPAWIATLPPGVLFRRAGSPLADSWEAYTLNPLHSSAATSADDPRYPAVILHGKRPVDFQWIGPE